MSTKSDKTDLKDLTWDDLDSLYFGLKAAILYRKIQETPEIKALMDKVYATRNTVILK